MSNIDAQIQEVYSKLSEERKKDINDYLKSFNGRIPNPVSLIRDILGKDEKRAKMSTALFIAMMIANEEKPDGKGHRYSVGMLCGGVMEDPYFHYEDIQEITAKTKREAEEKYNKINKCTYYYGKVISQLD